MGEDILDFGLDEYGKTVYEYIIKNENGMSVHLINYGAIVKNIFIKKDKNEIDIALGYDDLNSYISDKFYMGAIVGRIANRISNAHYTLGDKIYTLEKNDGTNNLHSYPYSWSKKYWQCKQKDENSVMFELYDKEIHGVFPGNIHANITYTLTDKNALEIDYNIYSDAQTILAPTSHIYFNLSGGGNLSTHMLKINADKITTTYDNCAPNGGYMYVKNTAFDFTSSKLILSDINSDEQQLKICNGYDHNFCINKKQNVLDFCAKVISGKTNISMSIYSDLPGMHFYTGNFLEKTLGKGNKNFDKRHGLCFETQFYPDAINHQHFTSPITNESENFKSKTIFSFDY